MENSLSEAATAPEPSPVPAADPTVDPVVVPGLAATRLHLPTALRRDLAGLVEASYPFEACGVMVGRADAEQVIVEGIFHARNLNVERARDRFLLDPQDFMAADRAARDQGLDIVGIWHSHPDHPARPSITDLEAAWEGYSYLIIATNVCGTNDFRSWRLRDGRFVEEALQDPPAEALADVGHSEEILSEERHPVEVQTVETQS